MPEITWRSVLYSILQDIPERKRIAAALHIHEQTLVRWATGETQPRQGNLQRLLEVLPETTRNQLYILLEKEMPGLIPSKLHKEHENEEIPASFIFDILRTRAQTPVHTRSWGLIHQILQHALQHLDPDQKGMVVSIARCMPPGNDGKIHSLLENTARGTGPWLWQEHPMVLLGAESLCGYAASRVRFEQIPDLRDKRTLLPTYQAEHEMSAAAVPILYGSRIAGSLLFSSTQLDVFSSARHRTIIENYSYLISLAFQDHEFYQISQVELWPLPEMHEQREYVVGFRPRVLKIMQQYGLNSLDAEDLAWRQIEAELLGLPLPEPKKDS